jgi:transcription initiation factor TFIIIB Brf1 subunit/transcription initiation factor TFIIB
MPVIIVKKQDSPKSTGEEKEKKVYNHSIAKDLQTMDISLEIKRKADEICQTLKQKTHRNKKRKYLIFFCIYMAYKELDDEKDANVIAKLVGLPNNKTQAAFSLFSTAKTGYVPKNKYTSADDLLPHYCRELGLEEKGILELLQELIDKDKDLDDEPPQTLAAGLLKYYSKINGIQLSDAIISRVCGRTVTCISNMMVKVSQVHNS